MPTLRVHDVLADKILVSRESARLLQAPLRAMLVDAKSSGIDNDGTPSVIDFQGVERVAPSFLDELLSIFESLIAAESAVPKRSLTVANRPTRLSLKFEAVARGHGMSVRALPDGSWLLCDSAESSA